MKNEVFRVDLQVHLFGLNNYGLIDVLRAMEKRKLDVIASLAHELDNSVTPTFTDYSDDAASVEESYLSEPRGIYTCFTNKKTGKKLYIIYGEEVTPRDREFHFLSIGATEIKSSLQGSSEDVMNEILGKGGLLIFDHPFVDPQNNFKDIDFSRVNRIEELCRNYKGKFALGWNAYCIPWVRRLLPGCSDVNSKTEVLSWKYWDNDVPLVPTSNTHARNKKLLDGMGRSFVAIPKERKDPFRDFFEHLKASILSGSFEEHRKYASFFHFAKAFGIPTIKRSRAEK
jgi:hypothetical protein